MTIEEKKRWIEATNPRISIAKQCRLLDLPRASYYYQTQGPSALELELLMEIDLIYTERPSSGSRMILQHLVRKGYAINRKRVQAYMRKLGLVGQQPGPLTSRRHPEHIKYPYLLKGLEIVAPLEVWSTDITYIRVPGGFVYLTAVMDWHSRLVLSSQLSNSLEGNFCIEALEEALEKYGKPNIFNTDQGVQFTSKQFVNAVIGQGIRLSMDGRGSALDNIFIERLWRSLKYEEVYLHEYQNVSEARKGIDSYFDYYNNRRPHQSLGYKTPHEVHFRNPNME